MMVPVRGRGSDGVADGRAGSFAHAPPGNETRTRTSSSLLIDDRSSAWVEGAVPDAGLVEHAVEVPDTRRRPSRSSRRGRPSGSSPSEAAGRREGRLEIPVEVQAPCRAVVGGGGMVPDTLGDRGRAAHRVVQARGGAGRPFFEVRGEDVGRRRRCRASQFSSTLEAASSVSCEPWVTNGMKFTTPSVPVVSLVPGPVRLNHVSIVNWARSSLAGSPNVTYAVPEPRLEAGTRRLAP